uniref:Ig-like domain-containing protein n=1 Tax=Strongyloides papillosus TaxID=174720 RepID=A0A0N5B517_STREA
MFLKLYWLGAVVALIPLLIQLEGTVHNHLFPYVTKNITKIKFPVDLGVNTSSDVVLVRCPYKNYKHLSKNDQFFENTDIVKLFEPPGQRPLVFWLPLLRKPDGYGEIKCGTILIKMDNDNEKSIGWNFKVRWNNTSQQQTTVLPANMGALLPEYHNSCTNDIRKVIIVTKNKNDNIPIRVDPRNIKEPYTKQMFYYFVKPDEDDMDSIKKPCIIMKGFKNCPIINLPGYNENSITSEVKKISIEDLRGHKKNITVNLILDGKKDFYRDEEISLSKMRYTKNGTEVIEGSTIPITSSFVINGFDLVKLVYNCWNGEGNQNVSQNYYFGPTIIDHTQDKTEEISANNTSIKVKCDTTYLNIGYLKGVKYNGIHAGVEDLDSTDSLRGKFSREKNSISFVESENGTTIISCIYKTLDGSITTTTKFINKDKIVGTDLNEKQVAKDKTVLISSSTISPNKVKKEVKDEENDAIKRTRTLVGVSMLFLLLLPQL